MTNYKLTNGGECLKANEAAIRLDVLLRAEEQRTKYAITQCWYC